MSGHTADRFDDLSTTTMNLGWGKQRRIRNSILTKDDLGECTHDKQLTVGTEQYMFFRPDDSPPIFDQSAEKIDKEVAEILKTRKLTAAKLRKKLEDKGLNSAGRVKDLEE